MMTSGPTCCAGGLRSLCNRAGKGHGARLLGVTLCLNMSGVVADDWDQRRLQWHSAVSIYSEMMKVEALHQFNHDSVVLYHTAGVVAPMRIIQRDGLERVMALSGPERELIHEAEGDSRLRTEKFDFHVHSPDGARPSPASLRKYWRDLHRHYHIHTTGHTVIAGEPAWEIAVLSLDNLRYSYRFNISKRNRMLLGFMMADERFRPVEKVSFTDVRLLESESTTADAGSPDTLPAKEAGSMSREWPHQDIPWQFIERAMPPGFFVHEEASRQVLIDSRPVVHMVVSDGIAFVSVFIEEKRRRIPRVANMAGFNAHSVHDHDHQITTVGATPLQTLDLIAKAVHPMRTDGDESHDR